MNYRDYFKRLAEVKKTSLPEGIDESEFVKGLQFEMIGCGDESLAESITIKNLTEDAKYYSKITETDEEGDEEDVAPKMDLDKQSQKVDANIGKMEKDSNYRPSPFNKEEEDENIDVEFDDEESGLPKLGGALAIPHHGQPIHMSKIIQVGSASTGKSATGELSGYTAAKSPGDKEPITAGGKKTEDSVTTRSVGGEITNKDAKQEGPNHGGTIEKTAKMNEERKSKLKSKILKEIRYDKDSKKWVRITENTVNMRMGPSYKKQAPQYRTAEMDPARTKQYDPEITEMYDEEEENRMMERYIGLVNANYNLTTEEIVEMKHLGDLLQEEKWIQKAVNPAHKGYCTPMTKKTCTPHRKALAKRFKKGIEEDAASPNGTSYKVVAPRQARINADDHAREVQHQPDLTEAGGMSVQKRSYRTEKDNPQHPEARWSDEVYESSELNETEKKSSVRKEIEKSNKSEPKKKNKLQHKSAPSSKSGVHKKEKKL